MDLETVRRAWPARRHSLSLGRNRMPSSRVGALPKQVEIVGNVEGITPNALGLRTKGRGRGQLRGRSMPVCERMNLGEAAGMADTEI
jgi:hypothetical protein